MQKPFTITGRLVDIWRKEIYAAEIQVEDEKIAAITKIENAEQVPDNYILPGFIDSHVHIESSMIIPSEFARLAVVHGTVATVSDPHEIANVCGMDGVEFMIENGKKISFKFNFGAPSCVPATNFETAGASLNSEDVKKLLQKNEIKYLSEMMNFPGVLSQDSEVIKKIAAAHALNKPVDGHAPGLRGETAKKYIDAGISTDHECFTKEEALDKLKHGMKIIIREGSAAKNFEALIDLLNDHEDMMMFCSDDKHPDGLVEGHINQLCARAIAKGVDVFKVLKAACVNAVGHYKLKVGLLRENDFADFVVVKDLKKFEVIQTYINGQLVAANGKTLIESQKATILNNFDCSEKYPQDFQTDTPISFAIEALDGQLITNKILLNRPLSSSDVANDLLKIVVVNRYKDAPVAKAFIKNFGLKKGAIASSVAHDSHNIVAVGVDDENICNEDGYKIAEAYTTIDKIVKEKLGSTLSAPFMTLSFMALLVIPHLKLSDK